MAEGGEGLDASPENRDGEEVAKITQFQELTGIDDLGKCREKLEQHGWDIERAVHDTFNEREGVSGVYNEPPAEELRRRNVPSPPTPPPLVNNNRFAQRVFHARPVRNNEEWSLMTWSAQLVMLPFRFCYTTIFDVIRFVLGIFRPDPRRRLTDPVADVQNFIREYNSLYGRNHPTFYHGTYSQALADAKKELRFLLVYLHGDDHQDTGSFCEETLIDEEVIDFINTNSLFWACNVNSGEGYRVSQALRENTYPFLAVILLKDNRMTVVARIEGLMPPEELLTALRRIKDDNEMHLIAARMERDERTLNRSLREEQDAAYLESERQDREKAQRKQEELDRIKAEEDRLEQEEKDRLQEIENRAKLKEQWRLEIPEEPALDHPDCIKILIKLPSSSRIERRFLKTHSLKYLYYFVFCHEDAPDNFDIVTNFPRKTLPCKPQNGEEPPTFLDQGIVRSEMLFVHDHDA